MCDHLPLSCTEIIIERCSGYIVTDPDTFAAKYIVSGGLCGGVSGTAVTAAYSAECIMASASLVEALSLTP